jgi:hypothetical protein
VELRGVVEPGAKVKVNGRPVTVRPDGTFLALGSARIRVEVEREGKKKTAVRSFTVRKS